MPPDDRQYSEDEVQELLQAALRKQKELLNNTPPLQNPQNNPNNDSVYSGAQQFIQAAQGIENVKKYFRSPVVEAIENSMGNLISSSLERSLHSMQNPAPQQEQKSFGKTLAEIAVHNMSQQVPQILQVAQEILGADRVKKGYDTGLQYFEQQNERQNIPNIVAQLDPNEPEHIKYYAELMGISDFELAQNKLIDHINSLSRGKAQPQAQAQGQGPEYYEYDEEPQAQAQPQRRGEPEVSRTYHEPPGEKKPKKQVIQEAEIIESYEPEPEENLFTQTSNKAFWTGQEPEPEPELTIDPDNLETSTSSTGFYTAPEPEPEPEIYRVKPKGMRKVKLKRSGGKKTVSTITNKLI